MHRREFVRAVMAVGVLPNALLAQQIANPAPPPPAPVPWSLGLNPKTPLPVTEAADGIAEQIPTFFSVRQQATLIRLCDLLVPSFGSKPSATQAGTPQFLDFLIGSSSEARKKLYRGGLDWLEAQTTTNYKMSFAQLAEGQAGALIKPWLRTWMSDHPPTEMHADFINIAHEDIRTATQNSKAWDDASAAAGQDWVTNGLYWFAIQPDVNHLNGPTSPMAHIMAMPRSAHSMPSYPR